MLTDVDKKVVAAIQGDIPISQRPYKELAESIGISEAQFLEAVRKLHDQGVIRRFGATIRHQKSGFSANAMVAWNVDEAKVHEVGKIFAGFKGVSHCYRRNPVSTWPYNLYTMIHAQAQEECVEMAREMAHTVGVEDYNLLFSKRELKKTSMEYFPSDDDD
ncbi:putative transcriptional regulator, AsnC family [Desulfatibacillum aliphaticivorans]|uniref:siroheme decarboxylase n=1 Tax=Desulfatibacillum aliphaticivorans TaxID=218208 RepID=B8FMC0_DESAL|nr:winged helix-turn-helix transcriptional regulator [Desulfatibacillum aliphaticivorans]ACL05958.1 putative transcriptional regulator, AsnC family [Desulfatibacillum aliphaticivorans]